jgi:DNA end-binding protein Ku
VVIEPEEIDKLRSPKERSINIDSFIATDTVDPAYYSGKTWYLTPDGPVAQKPYALLRKVMAESKRVVISGKQQLVMFSRQ